MPILLGNLRTPTRSLENVRRTYSTCVDITCVGSSLEAVGRMMPRIHDATAYEPRCPELWRVTPRVMRERAFNFVTCGDPSVGVANSLRQMLEGESRLSNFA